jgi:hypothetical protein
MQVTIGNNASQDGKTCLHKIPCININIKPIYNI